MRDYYGRKDLPWYAEMECTTATTRVSTPANMITGRPLENTNKAQVEPQERRKRDREYGPPSQGSPRPVMHKHKPAVQAGIEQYGFGPTAGGETQKHQA